MSGVLSMLCVASAFPILGVGTSSSATLGASEFGADDECVVENGGNSSECALNALQHRGLKRTSVEASKANTSAEAEGSQLPWGCSGCMQGNSPPGVSLSSTSTEHRPIYHFMLNCWNSCGKKSGFCSWCGPGNACCRYMYPGDPPECKTVSYFPVLSWHTCTSPVQRAAPPAPAPALGPVAPGVPSSVPGTTSREGEDYQPVNRALAAPSDAPLLTFYMYRAMGDNDYAPENVNTASLAGIMWYLHNEVVVLTPRKFGITRIVRMKVQTKAPAPLHDVGMNFGVRYAFDSGRCTGPWSCDKQFGNYGYFVGCNNVGDFPTEKWSKANHYADAIWYSLPGPCSNRKFSQHDSTCLSTSPGGACAGEPTGRGNCTYSATPAGEIRIDELEGIVNYKLFALTGGREYVHTLDRGVNLHFWDGKTDPARCAQRVKAAEDLFAAKYGPAEPLETPKCDFWRRGFYGSSPA